MTDVVKQVAARTSLEASAQDLSRAVTKALKHVGYVFVVFVLVGISLVFLLLFIPNVNTDNIDALSDPSKQTVSFHYLLQDSGISLGNLFVASTAMLAVVAAINIGIAVMPKPGNFTESTRLNLQSRARLIVWNRSLGTASYFCALVCIISAEVAWMSGPFRVVGLSALTLTIISLITVLMAANVAALASDEAEKIVGWNSQKRVRRRMDRGVRKRLTAWRLWKIQPHEKKKLVKAVVSVLAGYFLIHSIVALLAILPDLQGAVSPSLFSSWLGWVVFLLASSLYMLVGFCVSAPIILLNYLGFCSRLRHPITRRLTSADSIFDDYSRLRARGYVYSIASLNVGLAAVILIAWTSAGVSGFGVIFTVVWILLPQLLCLYAWMRGKGPLGFLMKRAVVVCSLEICRLDASIVKDEAELIEISRLIN